MPATDEPVQLSYMINGRFSNISMINEYVMEHLTSTHSSEISIHSGGLLIMPLRARRCFHDKPLPRESQDSSESLICSLVLQIF